MATTKKAQAMARDLVDVWAKEVFSTLPIITQTADASGNPVITLSADTGPAFSEKVVVVLIKPYVTGTATDVFGNTANAYTPHVIQVCTEANYASTNDTIADILTPVELLPVICEIAKKGCLTEWHVTANGTVPSEAAITAGTVLKATWRPLYFGVQNAQ
jgi:hypothetical protein